MSKASKPSTVDVSKVRDAITVLKSRGDAHYRSDIAAFTGLPLARVDRVLAHLEAQAIANPIGRITIPWTRMRGKKGGIAITNRERVIAANQRRKSLDSQARRHDKRCETEYRRRPAEEDIAMLWARAGRFVGSDRRKAVRNEIDVLHMDAMRDLVKSGKLDIAEAFTRHYDLMAEIDTL